MDRNAARFLGGELTAIYDLEKRILNELDRTDRLGRVHGEATAMISAFRKTMAGHLQGLERRIQALNLLPHEPTTPQQAGIDALVALLEHARTQSASLELLVHHTVIGHLTQRYNLLLTTASAVDDKDTVILARSHFRDSANMEKDINYYVPQYVINELMAQGIRVDTQAAEIVQQQLADIWKEGR